MFHRLFIAHAVTKSNHMLKDDDQLTTHAEVIPGEVSLLWQKGIMPGVHTIAITNIHFTKSTFDEKFILCFLSHFSNT